MMKPLSRVYIQGIYLNIIKAIYPNSTANIVPSGEKLKDFPLKSETREGYLLSSLPFNTLLEILASDKKKKKY